MQKKITWINVCKFSQAARYRYLDAIHKEHSADHIINTVFLLRFCFPFSGCLIRQRTVLLAGMTLCASTEMTDSPGPSVNYSTLTNIG